MDIIIRPPVMADVPEINAIRRMDGVKENTMGMASEPVSRSEAFIKNLDKDTHVFVAEVDGKVVGMAGLHHNNRPRKSHVAQIGISVHTEYQGKGVGTRLMEALLDIADNWLMLLRVELTVLEGNDHAKKLYERLGFEVEGIQRMSVVRDGRYVDEIAMARIRVPDQFKGM